MSIIIRLQHLSWSASAADVREFFHGMTIPEGGVHIVGGRDGDAFIAFASDEDARLAMRQDGKRLKDNKIKLLLSSRQEMQKVIEKARTEYIAPVNANESAAPTSALNDELQDPRRKRRLSKSRSRSGSRERVSQQSRSRSPHDRTLHERDHVQDPRTVVAATNYISSSKPTAPVSGFSSFPASEAPSSFRPNVHSTPVSQFQPFANANVAEQPSYDFLDRTNLQQPQTFRPSAAAPTMIVNLDRNVPPPMESQRLLPQPNFQLNAGGYQPSQQQQQQREMATPVDRNAPAFPTQPIMDGQRYALPQFQQGAKMMTPTPPMLASNFMLNEIAFASVHRNPPTQQPTMEFDVRGSSTVAQDSQMAPPFGFPKPPVPPMMPPVNSVNNMKGAPQLQQTMIATPQDATPPLRNRRSLLPAPPEETAPTVSGGSFFPQHEQQRVAPQLPFVNNPRLEVPFNNNNVALKPNLNRDFLPMHQQLQPFANEQHQQQQHFDFPNFPSVNRNDAAFYNNVDALPHAAENFYNNPPELLAGTSTFHQSASRNCSVCVDPAPPNMNRYGDVREFFHPMRLEGPDAIKFAVNEYGEKMGRIYCRFSDPSDADTALHYSQPGAIRICLCSDEEFDHAIDGNRSDVAKRLAELKERESYSKPNDSHKERTQRVNQQPWDAVNGRYVVELSNIPYKAEDFLVYNLVGHLKPVCLKRKLKYQNNLHLQSDTAFVEFDDERNAEYALELQGSPIMGRPINFRKSSVYIVDKEDVRFYSPHETRRSPTYSSSRSDYREKDRIEHRDVGGGVKDKDNRRDSRDRDRVERDRVERDRAERDARSGRDADQRKPRDVDSRQDRGDRDHRVRDDDRHSSVADKDKDREKDRDKNVDKKERSKEKEKEPSSSSSSSQPPTKQATDPGRKTVNPAGTPVTAVEKYTCLMMTGLAPNIQVRDVIVFFTGLRLAPNGVRLSREPRGTFAYVEFCSARDCELAVGKNHDYMGAQMVTLRACSKTEMVESGKKLQSPTSAQQQKQLQPQKKNAVVDSSKTESLNVDANNFNKEPAQRQQPQQQQQNVKPIVATQQQPQQSILSRAVPQQKPVDASTRNSQPPNRSIIIGNNSINNPNRSNANVLASSSGYGSAVGDNTNVHHHHQQQLQPVLSSSFQAEIQHPVHQANNQSPSKPPQQQQLQQPLGVDQQQQHALVIDESAASLQEHMPEIDSSVVGNLGLSGFVCFLHNLPPKVTLEEICALFQTEQMVDDSVRMHYSSHTGEPTGDCLLAFNTKQDAQRACDKTHQKIIFGRQLQMWLI